MTKNVGGCQMYFHRWWARRVCNKRDLKLGDRHKLTGVAVTEVLGRRILSVEAELL